MRIRVIEFVSTFTDIPNPENKNEFKIDTELSLKFDDWKEHFMSILIYYYKKYIEEGIYEPTEVLKCTKEYQKDNDTLKLYIEERVEDKDGGFITFSELYNDFKYWYKESGELKGHFLFICFDLFHIFNLIGINLINNETFT